MLTKKNNSINKLFVPKSVEYNEMDDWGKRCRRCQNLKPARDFYKSSSSKDGLQYWCKSCMDENKIILRNKHIKNKNMANSKKINYYKLSHGLKYELVKESGNKRSTHIMFYCLSCGKKLKYSIEHAANNNFKCDRCLADTKQKSTKSSQKLVLNKKENDSLKFTPKLTDEYNNCEYNECKHNCKECSEQSENDVFLERIKELHQQAKNSKHSENIHVFVIKVPEIQTVPVTTEVQKDSLWTRIKKLFQRS